MAYRVIIFQNIVKKVQLLARFTLFPFALLFWLITCIRLFLYKAGFLKRYEFSVSTTVIGNLSTGGTGKTPHVEFLISALKQQIDTANIGVLSRGYRRQSSGFLTVTQLNESKQVGDEPLQIARKFTEVKVAVCESRVTGIKQLLKLYPTIKHIILDDAYQHLQLCAKQYILLSCYHNLFTQDYLLPVGNLREGRHAYQRANVIVVTKCPSTITTKKMKAIRKAIQPLRHQLLLFSHIVYNTPKPIFTTTKVAPFNYGNTTEVLLLTGIANSYPMCRYIANKVNIVQHLTYPDHYHYTTKDVAKIIAVYKNLGCSYILTTEKDAVRLLAFQEQLKALPIYYLPIKIRFVNGEEDTQLLLKHLLNE